MFLQPDKNDRKLGKFNKDRIFTEGWIEFKSKKVAKSVAASLNCNPVGGKRRSKAHDELWNIKYLPRFISLMHITLHIHNSKFRFKWIHLSERLAYEAAVKQQRMRTEISQVKREAEHFKNSVERRRRKSKVEKVKKTGNSKEESAQKIGESKEEIAFKFKQRETDAQIRKRKSDGNIFTIRDSEGEAKNKKARKGDLRKLKVRNKSKKELTTEKDRPSLRNKKEGDRTQLLQSVFGGSI